MIATTQLLKEKYSHKLPAFISILFMIMSCASNDSEAWKIVDSRKNDDGISKILIYYDMEGISGQDKLTSIDFPRAEYFEARELLTADVNAVISGLYEGGADSVFVVDAHGSFNPEPDILLDKMDPRAQMLFKKERFQPYVDLVNENNYDAIVEVAMHSRTGGGGFCEHTVNLGTDWILNGRSINESELLAFSWGRIGVPLVLVSGDDKLSEQLAWMDWLEMVTVKKAMGINDAELRPVDEVHYELKQAAKRSLENLADMKSVTLNEPVIAKLRVHPPADLSILERVPGINYENQSVWFEADDFIDAYNGMRGLLDVAQSGYFNLAAGLYLRGGQEAFMGFKNAIFESWQENAADTLPENNDSESTPVDDGELYFGSR